MGCFPVFTDSEVACRLLQWSARPTICSNSFQSMWKSGHNGSVGVEVKTEKDIFT
jgi:hypothetical protein